MRVSFMSGVCGFALTGAVGAVYAASASSQVDGPQRNANDGERDLTNETPVAPADSADRLNSCKWEGAGPSFVFTLSVACESGMAPLMGGCYQEGSAAELEQSSPYENGNIEDMPDEGEAWYAVDGTVGWSCKYNTRANTTVRALCCGAP